MKRFTSVLIAVILGAIATGIGTVPFLVLANQDRHRLDSELSLTKSKAAATEAEKQRIADEANKKVEQANEEVKKAQDIILEAQEDGQLLLTSEKLIAPPPKELSKWNPIVNLALGISISVPNGYSQNQEQASELIVEREIKNAYGTGTIPVIRIQTYDADTETQYAHSFASSTDTNYVIGGRLAKGREGILLDGSAALEFEVRSAAKSTHLVWMRDPDGSLSILKKILSTVQYQQ